MEREPTTRSRNRTELTRGSFSSRSVLAFLACGHPALLRRMAFADRGFSSTTRKHFVTVFLRGAADALNIVVPYAEPGYCSLRPTIAIPGPGSGGRAALDLDGFFALHPSLAPLKPLYDRNELAIVHAVGAADDTGSHFEARDFLGTATPGATSEGRLDR